MLALVPLVAATSACEDFGLWAGGQGELRWVLDHTTDVLTKASGEIPDTNDFILSIKDGKGR